MINAEEYRRLADDLRAQFGDDDELVADMLEGETDFHDVLGRLLKAEAEAVAFAAANKALAAEYSMRATALAARKDTLRRAMLTLANAAELRSIKHEMATLTVKAVAPRAVYDGDPAALPDEMQRWTCSADMAAIKAALAEGVDVPDAHMTNGGETLQIRRK